MDDNQELDDNPVRQEPAGLCRGTVQIPAKQRDNIRQGVRHYLWVRTASA